MYERRTEGYGTAVGKKREMRESSKENGQERQIGEKRRKEWLDQRRKRRGKERTEGKDKRRREERERTKLSYLYAWERRRGYKKRRGRRARPTCMGGMSGRHGRFSGLVTEGMSSMAPTMGLAGPRCAWALAMLALVGLVGLLAFTLCSDDTGKGPAWPGFEC